EAEQVLAEAQDVKRRATNDANQILADAMQQACVLRDAAEAEIDALRRKAHAEANQEARAEVGALVERIDGAFARTQASLKHDLVALALSFAKSILRAEIRSSPEELLKLVSETLQSGQQERELRLHLHPDDVAILGDRIESGLHAPPGLQVIADEGLEPCSVRLVTAGGIHDGSLRTRLEALERHVTEQLTHKARP
ncbi:MAG: hypothetical protein KDB53_08710, partial [Planctomycetes bacterium]|nr:hypothetical protein [Planctomycetota bacterium]